MNLDPKILLAGMAVSLISTLPFNATFYVFTRTVICLSFIYGIYELNRKNNSIWILLMMLAILFNPIFPIYFNAKSTWIIIDIFAAVVFLYTYQLISPSKNLFIINYFIGRLILYGGLGFFAIVSIWVLYEEWPRPPTFLPIALLISYGLTCIMTFIWYFIFFNVKSLKPDREILNEKINKL